MPGLDSSARPELLLDYAHVTRQRSLGLRGRAVGSLADELTRARRTCPSLAGIPAVEHDVDDVLKNEYRLASTVEDVARAFLEADGKVALLAAGGAFVAVPAAAVHRPAGSIACLSATDIRALGEWVLDAGAWGWQHRQWVLDLLGSRGSVRVILGRSATPTLLKRAFGTGGTRLSIAFNLVNIIWDGKAIQDQGNPFRAFRRRGSNYVADYQQLWLDTSLVAFTRDPSPPTAAAVAVFATSWALWKTQDERRRAANRAIAAADRAQDRIRNEARDNIHRVTKRVRDWLEDPSVDPKVPLPLVEPALDAIDDTADKTDAIVDAAVEGLRRTVKDTQAVVGAVVDGGLATGEKVVDAGTEVVGDGIEAIKKVWPFH